MPLFLNGTEVSVKELKDYTLKNQVKLSDKTKIPLCVITSIAVYKEPLIVPVHFLVFQTADEKWWTVQKSRRGITFKTSKNREDVVNFDAYQVKRKAIEVPMEECVSARKTIFDLVNLFNSMNPRFCGHNLLNNNCWIFSKFVFDKFSKIKTFQGLDHYDSIYYWIKRSIQTVIAPFYSWAFYQKWEGFFFYGMSEQTGGTYNSILIAKDGDKLDGIEKEFRKLYQDCDGEFDEQVTTTWLAVYTTPLEGIYRRCPTMIRDTFGRQWTKVDYHAFIALETSDKFFWSIEKQQKGIYT